MFYCIVLFCSFAKLSLQKILIEEPSHISPGLGFYGCHNVVNWQLVMAYTSVFYLGKILLSTVLFGRKMW